MPALDARILRLEAARGLSPWDHLLPMPLADWNAADICDWSERMSRGEPAAKRFLAKLSDTQLDDAIKHFRSLLSEADHAAVAADLQDLIAEGGIRYV